jgi:hypothetical protein
MKLYTHCRPSREANFIKHSVTTDRYKQSVDLYHVSELGVVAVYPKPENNRYYNIGNRAYWISE